MIREIELNVDEMEEVFGGEDTGQHGPCSCNNCGTNSKGNDNTVSHSSNTPI